MKAEGIFRVPGDNDSVSGLKLRIDRGYYTLDGVDDPHVLASLMKLWLRELCDPLVPEELYNECIHNSKDPDACVQIVERLPTINRRVVLFVISFLQLFLEDRTQSVTKMTPANLALVMAPNLLRCTSETMSVVFTNAQWVSAVVYPCRNTVLTFTPSDMNKYSSTTYCFTSDATRLTITTSLHMVWVRLLVPLPKRTGIDLDIQINNDPLYLLNVFIVYTMHTLSWMEFLSVIFATHS